LSRPGLRRRHFRQFHHLRFAELFNTDRFHFSLFSATDSSS
jgi:hypothetical protein